jgi:hypothetical protein
MPDLQVGDEVYMVDIIFRRCQVVDNPITLNKDLMTLDLEEDNESYRIVDSRERAIDILIDKLKEVK